MSHHADSGHAPLPLTTVILKMRSLDDELDTTDKAVTEDEDNDEEDEELGGVATGGQGAAQQALGAAIDQAALYSSKRHSAQGEAARARLPHTR
eukprot:3015652-Pleurochrysis_carterae.AAC.1